MRKPSSRTGRVAAVLTTPLAVVAAAGLVVQASNAAFTATTRNSGNNWSTGSVTLTDDDAGSARFQVSDMLPGQSDEKCLKVTAKSSVDGVVKGYAINPVPSVQGLENHIYITVENGTGGGFGSCTGFVSEGTVVPRVTLATVMAANSYANGFGNWSVSADVTATRTYKIAWHFDTTGLTQAQQDQLQGASVGADVQWELQSS
jgi:hypothetical protein